MEKLKIFFLSLLFIVFVFLGTIFVFFQGAQQTLLQLSFYENSVEKAEISPLVVNVISDEVEEAVVPRLKGLPGDGGQKLQDSLRESLAQTFDEEWSKKTLLIIIEDGLSYLKGEEEGLTATIDLKDRKAIIKESMQSRSGEYIKEETETQMSQMNIPAGAEEEVRQEIENKATSEINSIIAGAINGIPDQVVLADLLKQHKNSEEIKKMVADFQWWNDRLKIYIYAGLIGLAVLILILAGILSGLKWLGAGMLASGIFVLMILLGLERIIPAFLNDIDSSLKAGQLRSLTDPFFVKMKIFDLYYILAGVAALLIGILIKKPRLKDNEKDS
ncbi:MAG: hypothetical protein ACOCVY_02365 [Patescibacteria group bacterium]